jgi:hypothetical protein
MALTKEAREYFVKQGRLGGKKSAAKLAKMRPEEVSEMKRRAARARWGNPKKDKEPDRKDDKTVRTLKAKARKTVKK